MNKWCVTRSFSSRTIFPSCTPWFHLCLQAPAHLLADSVDVLLESFLEIQCCNDLHPIQTIHGYLYWLYQFCMIRYSSFLHIIHLLSSSIMPLWALKVSEVRMGLELQVLIWTNVNVLGQMVWCSKIIRNICVPCYRSIVNESNK